MPDVVIVTDAEIRWWFGVQLRRTGPNGKKLTQEQLGTEIGGVSGSTISRNEGRLKRREPLTRPFRAIIDYELAAQKLDAKARWHLEQLRKTQGKKVARAVAEHNARLDRIKKKRQADAARLEAQRRAKEKRQSGLRSAWELLDAARPSWMQAGRLPLMPKAEEVEWFADALSLETRMMGEESMQLDRPLLGWSDTWLDDVEEKRITLDLLTTRARRRHQAATAVQVALALGKLILWLGFLASLAALLYFLYKVITWTPTVLSVLAPVAVGVIVYAAKGVGGLTSAALTSIVSVAVLLILTITLFASVPIRTRGQPESAWYPRVLGAALLSLVLLIITAVSWLASGGLTELR